MPNGFRGLPKNTLDNVLMMHRNDKEGTEKVPRENTDDIAAVLTEGLHSAKLELTNSPKAVWIIDSPIDGPGSRPATIKGLEKSILNPPTPLILFHPCKSIIHD